MAFEKYLVYYSFLTVLLVMVFLGQIGAVVAWPAAHRQRGCFVAVAEDVEEAVVCWTTLLPQRDSVRLPAGFLHQCLVLCSFDLKWATFQ